ncbi:MAG: response regulator, partial [Bacteroidia bacterium]
MAKVKILVVEDEIVIADNICDSLDELGYEVCEPAINYTEAVELLEAEKPDIAILDIQLAGSKDGIDLAWKIKEDYDIPFIFLTSNADPRTVDRAKKLTPPAYLIKPFVKDDLYTSIELALYNHYGNSFSKNEEEEPQVISTNDVLPSNFNSSYNNGEDNDYNNYNRPSPPKK